jgi:endonuclease G, mitochondrial
MTILPIRKIILINIHLIIPTIFLIIWRNYGKNQEWVPDFHTSAHLLLGNPDRSKENPRNHEKYLSRKPQFVLSYNDNQRIANWVSWHLGSDDIIGLKYPNKYVRDDSLPENFTPIDKDAYKLEQDGYARGHLCPSADRKNSGENNKATFLMSNITPQKPELNGGPWEKLEAKTRSLVGKEHQECYIISGCGFKSDKHKTIGKNQTHVPDWYWKVIVILPEASGDDLARITRDTRVIAVEMPNDATANRNKDYRVSPAEIERKTGLCFFTNLSPKIAIALRKKKDTK